MGEPKSKTDILAYFKDYRKEVLSDRKHNAQAVIRRTKRNPSSSATESLAAHLIKDGLIMKDKGFGSNPSVELRGRGKNNGDNNKRCDVLVNGRSKVEVKATTSVSGFTSKSKTNKEVFALIHLDLHDWTDSGSDYIKVTVHYDPNAIKTHKIHANGETKMYLGEENKKALLAGQSKTYEIHLRNFLSPSQDVENPFFTYE